MKHPVAVLNFQLAQSDDGWVQLLPAGEFSARDGRPTDVPSGRWVLTEEVAQRLISRAALRANRMVIDYEHQTLHAETNGQPAPAAGWFKDMQWRDGQGLFIKPEWTQRARQHIDADEYAYLSAVFAYDKTSGEPIRIRMAALTNDPGLDGLQSVASLAALKFSTDTETPFMDKHVLAILAALGVELAEGASPTEEQSQAALTALTAIKADAGKTNAAEGKVASLTSEVAALKANGGKAGQVDLSQYVPKATYDALYTSHAALRAGTTEESVERLLEDARKQGKVVEAEMDYLTDFSKQQGVAALKTMLEARPAVAALAAQQSTTRQSTANQEDKLTDEEEAVLKATGLSRDAFLKAKQEQ